MKKITLVFILFCFSFIGFAQDLYVGGSSTVTIESNASINANGLVLEPDTNYTINSNTNLQRIAMPAETGNTSINRQFSVFPQLTDYTGTLIFFYKDSELNTAIESELQLQIYDTSNDVWTPYAATLDENINSLTYNFTTFSSFSGITADEKSSLSVETPNINFELSISPNPTKDFIYIKYPFPIKTKLYSTTGQLIIEGTSYTLDLSRYEGATYFLIVEDSSNKTTKTFKIIKN